MKVVFCAIVVFLSLPALLHSQSTGTQWPSPVIFQVAPTPDPNFDSPLQAVSASGASDVWAVGQAAMHFDGSKWTAFAVPMIKGNNESFLGGVVDISPTLAWASGTVGIGSGKSGQVIEQWNGTAWSVFPGPTFAPGDQPNLFAMASTSADDIWAVGDLLEDGGQALVALFEHWDGAEWTVSTLGTGVPFLMGASADATNDAWAVGYDASIIDDNATLATHWNGSTWERVSTPNVGQGSNQLNGVVALAPNDVWAVGVYTPSSPPTLTLIEHYDGTSWTVVPSPNVGPHSGYQSNRLFGITAVSPTDMWAFGSYFTPDGSGHQKTLLEHWDGTSWALAPSPNPTESDFLSDLLFAGVLASPHSLWIVGAEDEAPHEGSMAIHTANP
jgi:hypothetical protein